MKKDGQKVSLVSLEGNLKQFNGEFILAGPRQVVFGAYRKLLELGAWPQDNHETIKTLIAANIPVVVLCINDKYPKVGLKQRSWWDYWHNKKKRIYIKPAYRTYNIPRQMEQVINKLVIKPIETLIPEEV